MLTINVSTGVGTDIASYTPGFDGTTVFAPAGTSTPIIASPAPGILLSGSSADFSWTALRDYKTKRWIDPNQTAGQCPFGNSADEGVEVLHEVVGVTHHMIALTAAITAEIFAPISVPSEAALWYALPELSASPPMFVFEMLAHPTPCPPQVKSVKPTSAQSRGQQVA